MKRYSLTFLFYAALLSFASGQTFDKLSAANNGGCSSSETCVTKDRFGNIYVASPAYNSSVLTIDSHIVVTGFNECYSIIVKYNSDLEVVWTKQIQSDVFWGTDDIHHLVTDDFGNLYLSGWFASSPLKIENDTIFSNNNGYNVMKFDSSGNFISRLLYNQRASILCFKENLYIITENRLEKLDLNLNVLWTKSSTCSNVNFSVDYSASFSVNDFGDIVIVGKVESAGCSSFKFDTDSIVLSNNGAEETVIIKADSNGSTQWIRSWPSVNSTDRNVSGVDIDSVGNIYLSIIERGMSVFAGDTLKNFYGSHNGYSSVLKYTFDGIEDWAIPISSKTGTSVSSLSVVEDQNIVFGGNYSDSTRLGGLDIHSHSTDYFILKVDQNMNSVWNKISTDSSFTLVDAITMDNNADYWLSGRTNFGNFDCFDSPYSGFFLAHLNNNAPAPTTAAFSFMFDVDSVRFQNASGNAQYYHWDFGDGTFSNSINPVHHYASDGTYQVTLTAFQGNCIDSSTITLLITGVKDTEKMEFKLFPNPTTGELILHSNNYMQEITLSLVDIAGQLIEKIAVESHTGNLNFTKIDLSHYPRGVYFMLVTTGNKHVRTLKIVLI